MLDAFCCCVQRLSSDAPDERLTLHQSEDDPGVLPDEQVLWPDLPDRVLAGVPSARESQLSGQRRTGRQYPVTGCTPVLVPPRQFPDRLTAIILSRSDGRSIRSAPFLPSHCSPKSELLRILAVNKAQEAYQTTVP